MASRTLTEIHIDGAMGEGGGQILRSSLALSACLGKSFRISNIRAARANPGLQPQHLAAVKAAAQISNAHVEGAEKDSLELLFVPLEVTAGEYHFAIGTAGSTSLVLQTVLPALILSDRPSSIVLEGGTHNPFAPPFEFLQYTFLPILNQMGPEVTVSLERPGFAPKGGGRVKVDIHPVKKLKPFQLIERGAIIEQRAEVLLAHLPGHVARRELAVIKSKLGVDDSNLTFTYVNNAFGAGNTISVIVKSEYITECFTAFGYRGRPAEQVAGQVVDEVQQYLLSGVPVGRHLADQLLLPMALSGSGKYLTMKPTSHTLTNVKVISAFMDVKLVTEEICPDTWLISIS